jgi:hypothetical protein
MKWLYTVLNMGLLLSVDVLLTCLLCPYVQYTLYFSRLFKNLPFLTIHNNSMVLLFRCIGCAEHT